MRELTTESVDHPVHGSLRPARGTIEAPIAVVGATGTIGSAVVGLLVAAGQPVIAIAPSLDRLGTLRDASPSGAVLPFAGRVETDADAARLARRLRELGRPLAGVVVTFPHGRSAVIGADRGRLLDQSTETLCECLRQTVLAQHALARHVIPLLAESGRNTHYVIVGGPGSETPWAGFGHRSVAMAATRMLARVLHDEARPSGVRVQLLSIDSPLRSDEPGAHECPEWPTAGDIAHTVLRLTDRSTTERPTDAVVTSVRSTTARALVGVARPSIDVPSFLASLRNSTNKMTPQ